MCGTEEPTTQAHPASPDELHFTVQMDPAQSRFTVAHHPSPGRRTPDWVAIFEAIIAMLRPLPHADLSALRRSLRDLKALEPPHHHPSWWDTDEERK